MDDRSTAAAPNPALTAVDDDEYAGLVIRHRNRLDTETRRQRRRVETQPLRRPEPRESTRAQPVRLG